MTPACFQILLSLAGEDRHGYAIMQDIASRSGGKFKLGPGTLYTNIRRLLEAGLIEEIDERPDAAIDDERRRYYRITRSGRRAAQSEAQRMEVLLQQARITGLLPRKA